MDDFVMPALPVMPAFNPAETYTLGANGSIHRGSDGACIPHDEANADYRAFVAWQASGKTPAPYVPPPPPPVTEVPMWAAQAALKAAGLYDSINAYILAHEADNAPAYFAWTMGNYASRSSEFIAGLASQLGITDAQIDALFAAADEIAKVAK